MEESASNLNILFSPGMMLGEGQMDQEDAQCAGESSICPGIPK